MLSSKPAGFTFSLAKEVGTSSKLKLVVIFARCNFADVILHFSATFAAFRPFITINYSGLGLNFINMQICSSPRRTDVKLCSDFNTLHLISNCFILLYFQ